MTSEKLGGLKESVLLAVCLLICADIDIRGATSSVIHVSEPQTQ